MSLRIFDSGKLNRYSVVQKKKEEKIELVETLENSLESIQLKDKIIVNKKPKNNSNIRINKKNKEFLEALKIGSGFKLIKP